MSDADEAILIEDVSPNGNVMAIADASGGVVHFYLRGREDTDFGIRSVWVRNLGPAPETLDAKGMRAGEPPMMPAPPKVLVAPPVMVRPLMVTSTPPTMLGSRLSTRDFWSPSMTVDPAPAPIRLTF